MESFSITTFRKQGVLTRVFVSFLSLSLVLLLIFFAAGAALLNDHYQKQSTLSTQDMLDKAQIASTIALQQTMDSVQQITQNEAIISSIAVPDINNGPRAIEIVNHLQYVQRQCRYIDAVFYYSNYDDAVYSSSGTGPLSEFYAQDVVSSHLHSRVPSGPLPDGQDRYGFFIHDGQFYITYAFPVRAPYENATIYARLSKSALSDILNLRTNGDEQYIQLYSPDNVPILNVESPISNEILDQTAETPTVLPYLNGQLFLCESPSTGLKYLYHQPSLVTRLPLKNYLSLLLPLVPVILLCSVFIALNLTEYLYKPIRKMMRTISDSTYHRMPDGETELDYLAEALTDLVVRNDDLTKAISAIRPELEQKLYHSLVTSTLPMDEANEELLQTLQFTRDVPCTVLAIQAASEHYQPLSKVESTMCLLAVKQLLHAYPATRCPLHIVDADDSTLAVALVFPENELEAAVQAESRSLAQYLHRESSGLSYNLFIAIGGHYTGLPMLHTSFMDACQLINYQKYVQDGQSGRMEAEPAAFYKNYVLSQVNQAHLYIQNAEHERAEQLLALALNKVFRQFEENSETMDRIRLYCGDFIDLMIGQLSDMGRTETRHIDRTVIEQELQSLSTPSDLLTYMKERYRQFLQVIVRNQSKQQNKYIAAAKEYIQNHYTDYTLSLDSAAQQIGIHPNYLSRLFKEVLGINFVEYLNKQRIERAKTLLETTRMTVKDIGFEVGFNSVQNYLRVFKKYEQLTPTQYRETQNKASPSQD